MAPLAVTGPLRRLLDMLGNKWTATIIDLLARRDARFSDLLAEGRVTPKMLTRVLRDLETEGIVIRGAWPGQSGYPRYQLSPRGHALHAHLHGLDRWANDLSQVAAPALAASGPQPTPAPDTATPADGSDEAGVFTWGRPRMHIAIATATLDRSRRLLASLFGTLVPETRTNEIMRDGVRYTIEVCAWRFENMVLELVGSRDDDGPFAEFTRRRPAGVHHLSYYVGRSAGPRTRWLAQQADGIVWGHGTYAAFDFQEDLGVNISVADRTAISANAWPVVEVPRSSPFFHVAHLGVLVSDVHRALSTYQRVFGGPPARIKHFTPAFTSAAAAAPGAAVRLATCEQPNVALQFAEPSGQSPFGRFLEHGGNGVYALDFHVGDHLPDVLDQLSTLGARPIVRTPKEDVVVLEMPIETGFSIGLIGRMTSRASRTPARNTLAARRTA